MLARGRDKTKATSKLIDYARPPTGAKTLFTQGMCDTGARMPAMTSLRIVQESACKVPYMEWRVVPSLTCLGLFETSC